MRNVRASGSPSPYPQSKGKKLSGSESETDVVGPPSGSESERSESSSEYEVIRTGSTATSGPPPTDDELGAAVNELLESDDPHYHRKPPLLSDASSSIDSDEDDEDVVVDLATALGKSTAKPDGPQVPPGGYDVKTRITLSATAKGISKAELEDFIACAQWVLDENKKLPSLLEKVERVLCDPVARAAYKHVFKPGFEHIDGIKQSYAYFPWAGLSAIRTVIYPMLVADTLLGKDSPFNQSTRTALQSICFACALAVLLPGFFHMLIMVREWTKGQERYYSCLESAKARLVNAVNYINSERPTASMSRDFERFMADCKALEATAAGKRDLVKNSASLRRDIIWLPINLAVSTAAQYGLIFGGMGASTAWTTIVSGLAYAIGQGPMDFQQGLKAEKPKAVAAIKNARTRIKHCASTARYTLEQLQCTQLTIEAQARRTIREQGVENRGAIYRFLKGVSNEVWGACYVALGVTMVVQQFSGTGHRAGAGNETSFNHTNATGFWANETVPFTFEEVATAATIAGVGALTLAQKVQKVAGNVIAFGTNLTGLVYYPLTGDKMYQRGLNKRLVDARVRDGQYLCALYDVDVLCQRLKNGPNFQFTYGVEPFHESRGWAQQQVIEIAPHENEYLGLHMLAGLVAQALEEAKPELPDLKERDSVFSFLSEKLQMRRSDMKAMLLQAQEAAPARRLALIRAKIAKSVLPMITIEENGLETPMSLPVVVEVALEICKRHGIDFNRVRSKQVAHDAYLVTRRRVSNDGQDTDLSLAEQLHKSISPESFIHAVNAVYEARVRGGDCEANQQLRMLHLLAEQAESRRSSNLDHLAALPERTRKKLWAAMGLTREQFEPLYQSFSKAVKYYANFPVSELLKLDKLSPANRKGKVATDPLHKLNEDPLVKRLCAEPALLEALSAQDRRMLNERILDYVARPQSRPQEEHLSATTSEVSDAQEQGQEPDPMLDDSSEDADAGVEEIVRGLRAAVTPRKRETGVPVPETGGQ